jgi:hypothetical protein
MFTCCHAPLGYCAYALRLVVNVIVPQHVHRHVSVALSGALSAVFAYSALIALLCQ